MIIRAAVCFILMAITSGCIKAQPVLNNPIIQTKPGGTIGTIQMFNLANTFSTTVSAAPTLASNLVWQFPDNADTAGNCLTSTGSGQTHWGPCAALTVPVVISGSTPSTAVLTVTQLGAGIAFTVNGSLSGNHLQNVGTADGPSFATVSANAGSSGSAVIGFTTSSSTIAGAVFGSSGAAAPGVFGTNTSTGPGAWFFNSGSGLSLLVGGAVGTGGGGTATFTSAVIFETTGTTTFKGTSTFNSGAVFNSTVSGTHLQNLGTGDSPTFSSLTVANLTGGRLGGNTSGSGAAVAGFTTSTSAVDAGVFGSSSTAAAAVLGLANGSGRAGWFASNTGPAIYADSISGLSAEFTKNVLFDSSLTGTHAQNIGTGDSPTFSSITVSSCTGCGGGGGVTTFNSRTGTVLLSSTDVTGALGFTPAGLGANSYSGLQTSAGGYNVTGYAVISSTAQIHASAYYSGVTQGITSGTCSAWTDGLCTAP